MEPLDVAAPDPDVPVPSPVRSSPAKTGDSAAPQPADNMSAPRPPIATVAFTPVPFAPAASTRQPDTAIRPPVAAIDEAKAPQRPAAGADAAKSEAADPSAATGSTDSVSPKPDPVVAATQPAVAAAQPAAPAPVEPVAHVPVSSTDQGATPPAEQLGSILVASTRTVAGNQQLTVRLDPPELGRVNIAIAQPRAGAASVTLTVERPETLLMVLRDAPALHRALDRAGIPAEARTVTFELAPQRAPSPQQAHGQGSHSAGPAFDLAARDQWQRPGRQMPQRDADGTDIAKGANDASDANDEPTEDRPAYARMWQRAGIDITA